MTGERVPDTWVGALVSVLLEGDDDPLIGDLVQQNDGGIVLDLMPDIDKYPGVQSVEELKKKEPKLVFLTWRVVRFVTVNKEDITGATEETPQT